MDESNLTKIKDYVLQLDKELSDYEAELQLATTISPFAQSVVKQTLEMGEDLHKLSPEECQDRAIHVVQYCYFLQKQINKEKARIKWCDEEIRKLILPRVAQQVGATYEERKYRALVENTFAKDMHDVKVKLELRIERLTELKNDIKSLQFALLAKGKGHGKSLGSY